MGSTHDIWNHDARNLWAKGAGMHTLSRAMVCCLACALLQAVSVCTPCLAQAQPPAAEGMVRLNFPEEIELQSLVDFVSQRLNVRILYDRQTLATKKITLRAATDIPVNSLMGVLQSALKIQGLMLVDADVPGWLRVEKVENVAKAAPAGDARKIAAEAGRAAPVTQVFRLKTADPQQVGTAIKPFLSAATNTVEARENGVLIVTDYAANMLKVAEIVDLLDQAKPDVQIQFVKLDNLKAQAAEQQVRALLQAKAKAQGGTPGAATAAPGIEVAHEARTNQLIMIGTRDRLVEALQLVRTLDVPLGLTTEAYALKYVSPDRVNKLVQDMLDPVDADRLYKSAIDLEGNQLIATTTPEIHARIQAIRERLDVPDAQAQSPVRFYKIKNIPVVELLDTLRSLEEGGEPRSPRGSRRERPDPRFPGPNRGPIMQGPVQDLPTPPSYRERQSQQQQSPSGIQQVSHQTAAQPFVPGQPPAPPQGPNAIVPAGPPAENAQRVGAVLPNGARLTADPNTNTLIVIADPGIQRMYEDLIRTLDKRRPQVLIEAKVVTVDTRDDLQIGVEISGGDRNPITKLFSFTSFGFSEVDPATGALTLIPGLGFTGALLDSETADVIIRGLATHRRARLVSSPKVLVNDNATGILTSVLEVPFTSVNASQTVATTSFAGFAEAGTTINVTPHISEGDHLQLEFNVTLNSFNGTGTAGVPPPRQTDEVESEVTIPDGYTIVVGGLNRRNNSFESEGVPFLENVPLLKYAVSRRARAEQCNSLFVFIRPIILRDDKFRDLKFLSERDIGKSRTARQLPHSLPVLIK